LFGVAGGRVYDEDSAISIYCHDAPVGGRIGAASTHHWLRAGQRTPNVLRDPRKWRRAHVRLKGGEIHGDLRPRSASRLAMLPNTTHVTLMERMSVIVPMVNDFLDAEPPKQ
jgi:hypothetical protein